MKRTYKFLGILFLALFLAASCNLRTQNNSQTTQSQVTSNQTSQEVPPSEGLAPLEPHANATLSVQGFKQNQSLSFTNPGETVTALDLLKSNYQVVTKTFSGLGEFVESINGIKPDSKHFWAFYVNGKSSNVGAGSYTVKDGDKLEWKLDEISSNK